MLNKLLTNNMLIRSRTHPMDYMILYMSFKLVVATNLLSTCYSKEQFTVSSTNIKSKGNLIRQKYVITGILYLRKIEKVVILKRFCLLHGRIEILKQWRFSLSMVLNKIIMILIRCWWKFRMCLLWIRYIINSKTWVQWIKILLTRSLPYLYLRNI